LLNVVAQAFAVVVFICLCAGEDVPPSDKANEGCQWEVQIDEGCVPTRIHRHRSSDGAHSVLSFLVRFSFKPLYHNTWHSNYKNYFIT
jgi:hypothetical protein